MPRRARTDSSYRFWGTAGPAHVLTSPLQQTQRERSDGQRNCIRHSDALVLAPPCAAAPAFSSISRTPSMFDPTERSISPPLRNSPIVGKLETSSSSARSYAAPERRARERQVLVERKQSCAVKDQCAKATTAKHARLTSNSSTSTLMKVTSL